MRHGLSFVYLRDEGNNPTVALALLTTENSSQVSFQIATRSPKDAFNKAHARAAAGGRLTKYPVTIDFGVVVGEDVQQQNVVSKVLSHLVENDYEGVHSGPITRAIVQRYYDRFSEGKA